MNRRLLALLTVLGAVLLGSGGVLLWQSLAAPPDHCTVEVVQNNRVLYTFSYPTSEERTVRIPSADGTSWNDIRLHDGTICVSDAACADHTCVRMGDLTQRPIVCLPNRLVIRFAQEEIP